ncbi:MAG: undecaprenyl-phosphate glucose phosphotransferase [Lachnospiraceae bacterium]|nr:undecaprenyl-phosphate glucose phosphotransferase [Lachnospiraceae bacterium]
MKDTQAAINRLHIIVDGLLIIGAYMLTFPLRFYVLPYVFKFMALAPGERFYSFARYLLNLFPLVPGYLIIYNICGLYKPRRTHKVFKTIGSLIEANLLGIFYFSFLIFIQKQSDISRWFYISFGIINVIFGIIYRLLSSRIFSLMRRKGKNLRHVLLVGFSPSAQSYIDRINANPEWGYRIFGILDDEPDGAVKDCGITFCGTISKLEEIINENMIDEIVVTLNVEEYKKLGKIVRICEKTGVHTKFIPDYNNVVSSVPALEDLGGLPVINIRNVPLSNFFNASVKRVSDLLLGTIALLVFAIPMGVIALLIKCTSKGPVIFSQVRVGLSGKEFKMYKFRSMRVQDEESEKKEWTTKADKRVTGIGKIIRKTSLDELPQLFNVLRGDMSLVGPRPERPQFVEQFKEEIPRYMIKHQVRPGMTGWAQINGFRGDTSIRGRIDHDLYYIENWSIWFDLKILFLTIFKGFINKNAY